MYSDATVFPVEYLPLCFCNVVAVIINLKLTSLTHHHWLLICTQCYSPISYSMEESPFWEANSNSAGQELFRLIWNSEVRHRVYNSPPLDTVMSHMCSVHNFTLCFLNPLHIIIPSTPRSREWYLPLSNFSVKILHAFLISARATFRTHLAPLIWRYWYSVKNKNYKAPQYVIFSIIILFLVAIFFSAHTLFVVKHPHTHS
jgi:hypothetical protein